jgi:hypothetical protein
LNVDIVAMDLNYSNVPTILEQELYEKTTIYDDMVDRHQRELAAKQEELDQEVEACNRMYQSRLAEYEAEQEAKWLDMVSLK